MTSGRPNRMSAAIDYRTAGVDIDAGDAVVNAIGEAVRRTHGPQVIRGLGHFGGFYRLGSSGSGTTLVASIDGVGTKLKLAVLAGRHDTIGHDIVNHCVNDILACGAMPLFFLDYFATGKLDPGVAVTVIGSIASACEANGIALLGGETAEMPGIYHGEDYDLAGVVVGLVEESRIVDGSQVQEGDVVIGLSSSGFHTNGYSLVRAAMGLNGDEADVRTRLLERSSTESTESLADLLLEPHRSYLRPVQAALQTEAVTGMAHITGGGIAGNLSRIMPAGLSARLDRSTWHVPEIIERVRIQGDINTAECYRVFNMGVGYTIVCRPDASEVVLDAMGEGTVIGVISQGEDPVVIEGLA